MSFAGKPGQGEVDKGRVKRYRPGQAPDWIKEEDAEASASDEEMKEDALDRTQIAPPVIVKAADDPRLRRLARKQDASSSDSEGTVTDRGRAVAAPQVVSKRRRERQEDNSEEQSSEEEASDAEPEVDLDELERKRAAVRERLQERVKKEEEVLDQQAFQEEEEEEEEESEYETNSEEEQLDQQRLKPLFVKREERETIADRERQQEEIAAQQAKEKDRLVERQAETREIVKERHALEEAMAQAAGLAPKHNEGDVDTEDDADDPDEYTSWETREMGRIARYKDDQERAIKEAVERERMKNMTEEERKALERERHMSMCKDNTERWGDYLCSCVRIMNTPVMCLSEALERDRPTDNMMSKEKWKFLQKYWHKGAFFQESSDNPYAQDKVDEVYKRDYSGATGEDKMDKSVLPKVMQVKNFGRRGRTKHTHLVDQDTTKFDDDYAVAKPLQDKYFQKLGGTAQEFDRPKRMPHHKPKEDKPPPIPRADYLASRY